MTSTSPISPDLAHIVGRRLLVVGTGAPAVIALPEAVSELGQRYPGTPIRLVLTRQALTFVTATAVRLSTGKGYFLDAWHEGPYENAPHVEISRWAEAVIVYPATLSFLARLALGMADSPLLLALQCMNVPICLAVSLPPGGYEGAAFRDHSRRLSGRDNVVLVEPEFGASLTTGERNRGAPVRFSVLLERLNDRIANG